MRPLLFGLALLLALFVARQLNSPVAAPERASQRAHAAALRVLTPTGDEAVVVRVIDGDTVALDNGERVRYVGMDTPETKDPRKPVQCFGERAHERNAELVQGKRVRLVRDVSDRDHYGRLLRYVYVGDTFVNLELVEEGYARNYSFPPDITHQAEIRAAERRAREAKRGLWRECL